MPLRHASSVGEVEQLAADGRDSGAGDADPVDPGVVNSVAVEGLYPEGHCCEFPAESHFSSGCA
jgi:hypothetical protein